MTNLDIFELYPQIEDKYPYLMWRICFLRSYYPRLEDNTLYVFEVTKFLFQIILESKIRNVISTL